ncbi:MAG TPA: PTS IIA-like nitrogen regulatory protein PtsN [Alphaproteobacteria bacterium]|nr:PTS IIA-like nitrogen regulatory protein PtsN [Alphaproteobacteria bacterium]
MRDILSPQAVVANLAVATKKDVLQEGAKLAASKLGKDAHVVFDVLWERERLGTTGVGLGIAIPHGRLEGLDKVQGYFLRLAQPVGFESVDDKPVDLVFLLLAPADAGADHLHALATVSRLLRDQKLCEQIRKAKDEAAIYRLLTETPTAQAA